MSIASVAKRKGSPCQQDDKYQGGKRLRCSRPDLPEDIWHYIHSLLPLRDAARVGCVSRAFRRSWRCHPNLTFTKEILGLNGQDSINRVDQIMKNHSGIGVKTFKYVNSSFSALTLFDPSNLNSWLQIAVTPVLEELKLLLPRVSRAEHYNFPCSLLSSGSSIRSLHLTCVAFHPMARLGCLTRLYLSMVHISGDELGCLLTNSFALEELTLSYCHDIICLKIPCLLHRLSYLCVFQCTALEVIENKAPNLCTVHIDGNLFQLLLGDFLQVKGLEILFPKESNLVYHARAKLPSIMSNLETLNICSCHEMSSTPFVPFKFLHLKKLEIHLENGRSGAFSPAYDYFSLVSFLDACPILETFILAVLQTRMKHDSVCGASSHLRQMPEHRHGNIKNVEIAGFCSAKSMIELTCHILENATSLECLTLDTIYDSLESVDRLSIHKIGECLPVGRRMIKEAHKALLAIERYIVGKVPSTVKLNVKKPCSWCHAVR